MLLWKRYTRTVMSAAMLAAAFVSPQSVGGQAAPGQRAERPRAEEQAAPYAIPPSDVYRGADDEAKVSILFFTDYQCPYSAQMYQALFGTVMREFGDRVRVTLKDVPNPSIHPWAKRAASNSRCLAEQNPAAYWDFADRVHYDQGRIGSGDGPLLDEIALELGRKHGVDESRLGDCLRSQPDTHIKNSFREAAALGVTSVPTLVVNGKLIQGAMPAKRLIAELQTALKAGPSNLPQLTRKGFRRTSQRAPSRHSQVADTLPR